ncbi:MAG: ATP-binding protein [Lentisphaerae bacterium]|nr:ATP-binding protein [Lentisphaerota bacterium]
MHDYIRRHAEATIERRLANTPAVALLGPRQAGKSTLAKQILATHEGAVYLDLERPSDAMKLRAPEAFLAANPDALMCLDEIQRVPELFPVLRSVIDDRGRNGQFLILGSASPDLLRQSSETLAGRIARVELAPFDVGEVESTHSLNDLWLRGGFPRSLLAADEEASTEWRQDFVRTFLERDIPRLAARVATEQVGRLWQMCAHEQGQLLNSSKLGASLGVSDHTVRSYLGLLEGALVTQLLSPLEVNLKKRLVKSPKVYIRDTGLLHALLGIQSMNDLFGHPCYGPSWETLVVANVLARLRPQVQAAFYRTARGAELDLVLSASGVRLAIECKASTAPKVTRGFWNAIDDLGVDQAWLAAPVTETYPIHERVEVTPLPHLLKALAHRGWLY